MGRRKRSRITVVEEEDQHLSPPSPTPAARKAKAKAKARAEAAGADASAAAATGERLRAAAQAGRLDELQAALGGMERGDRALDLADWGGWTALMHAASGDKPELVEQLLKKGASVDATDVSSPTPALPFPRARSCCSASAAVPLPRCPDVPPSRVCALPSVRLVGSRGVLTAALTRRCDVRAQNDGWTVLHVAALNCAVKCLPLLLAAGADPSAEEGDGRTAYDLAAEYGWEAAMALPGLQPAARGAEEEPAAKRQMKGKGKSKSKQQWVATGH